MRALLLVGLAAALPAAAQSVSRSDSSAVARTVEAAPVTVTATRLPLSPADAPARVTVWDRQAIEATGAVSVADLLDAQAPVVVRRYGPSGLATLSVRGAGASQTLVLLDGLPLASPALGVVDLSLVPTALVETAEVLSGSASGVWGSSAVGGVVALQSGAGPGVRATVEAGPWGERRASASGRVEHRGFAVLAAAEGAVADDNYAVVDGFGRLRSRLGWDSRRASALAGLSASAGRARGRVLAWTTHAERGLGADSVGNALIGERQWDTTMRALASGTMAWQHVRVDVLVGGDASRLRWAAPYPAPHARPDAIDDTGQTRTFGADLRATFPVRQWSVTALLAAGRGTATHPDLRRNAADGSAAVAVTGHRMLGRVSVFPSLRVDRYAPSGQAGQVAFSPHLGLNAVLSDALRLKASAGRAFRMPTLNDRFWNPGGRPGLRPEQAIAADVGLAWTADGLAAEATLFGRQARDEIVWTPGTGGVWSPDNVARTQALGAEASATAHRQVLWAGCTVRLEIGAAATALHAQDLSTGRPLRYQPAWTTRTWAGARAGGVRAYVGARAVGSRPTTTSGSQPLPAYAVVDANVQADWARGRTRFTVGLGVDNLFNTRYESVRLYPMPPRHAMLRLQLTTR